jgi:SAM-dependent methyltransferase
MAERHAHSSENQSPDSNDKTLQAYKNCIQEYIDGTPHETVAEVKQWIDEALQDLDKNAFILELGSGFGADADYMEEQGYWVVCTDAVPEFVDILQDREFTAYDLNVLTDDLPERLDMVYASAVLLHFTREETAMVLRKVYASLVDGGRFAFSLKQGNGEGWSEEKLGEPRYFCYWQAEEIQQLLNDAGYTGIEIGQNVAPNATWLRVIAHKQRS